MKSGLRFDHHSSQYPAKGRRNSLLRSTLFSARKRHRADMFLGEAMDGTDEQPTLREKAYESFTRHLLARDVRPGQFVSQRRLVELTGLTLGAIRELIPRLEAEGLIKTVPQRG